MQSDVEILGPLERRLNVTVLQEKIESEVESRLKRLARTAKIHGFRSGKVPLKIVSQQYGPKVRQEVMGEVLQRSFGEAVLEQKLRVAGYPRFEAKEVTENTPQFEFSATFEVYPDVILGDLKSISIEQPAMQVSPADVDKAIEIMNKGKIIHIVGEDTDIKLNNEGRKFIKGDGTCNMLDGEIFTAPVDDSVNGHI
ncbi:MAG: aminopeptidase [Proteobacteria bacterium]|nr:aminopeptidase [Pseudomonadota bacterium]